MYVHVVFGATGGIGAELSRRLSARGDRLVLVAQRSEPLEALASELDAVPVSADATDPVEVAAAFAAAREAYGQVDGAVNAVGSILLKAAHRTSDDEWRQTLSLNLDTAFFVLREATRVMRRGGGAVVLLSSGAASLGLPNHEAIAAAKAGIEGLVRSSAASYAARNIRVNAVAPGLVRTPMSARLTANPASEKASLAMHPLGRLGEPADIAAAIAWLLGPESAWVTGQVLGVDGGLASTRALARA